MIQSPSVEGRPGTYTLVYDLPSVNYFLSAAITKGDKSKPLIKTQPLLALFTPTGQGFCYYSSRTNGEHEAAKASASMDRANSSIDFESELIERVPDYAWNYDLSFFKGQNKIHFLSDRKGYSVYEMNGNVHRKGWWPTPPSKLSGTVLFQVCNSFITKAKAC